MELDLIFKVGGVGLVVACINAILNNSNKSEYAMMTTLAGIVVVLVLVLQEIVDLFDLLKSLFGF